MEAKPSSSVGVAPPSCVTLGESLHLYFIFFKSVNRIDNWFSNLSAHQNHLEGLFSGPWHRNSDSEDLGQELRMCISNKPSGL